MTISIEDIDIMYFKARYRLAKTQEELSQIALEHYALRVQREKEAEEAALNMRKQHMDLMLEMRTAMDKEWESKSWFEKFKSTWL